MKTFVRSAALLLATGMLTFSCRQELDKQVQPAQPQEELMAAQHDGYRTQFAKTLARALEHEEVRRFIKQEAGKQFDMDYDVLFQLVKDTELSAGRTFASYLAPYAESQEQFGKVTESLPLLTILVPELKAFSNQKWDVATQIPLVAVVNSDHDEIKHTKLVAFDHLGNEVELHSNVQPTVPVLVVKENERVTTLSSNGRYSYNFKPKGSLIAAKGGKSFYFNDDAYNQKKQVSLKAARQTGSVEPRLVNAYNLGAESQRDYVYYNILTNSQQGPVNYSYAEHITAISFTDKPNMDTSINDEKLGDWSDGAFEFSLEFLFFNGTSAVKNDTKVFTVLSSELSASDGSTKFYRFPTPIRVATWDYKTMGDTWKIVVQEIDPSSSTTRTTQIGSKFSTNFKFDVGFGKEVKVGIGAGGSTETSNSTTVAYQTTQTSDQLGSVLIPFTQKILLSSGTVLGGTLRTYTLIDYNTGNVLVSMEPKLIQ
jgi:hypothetical protein